MIYSSAEALIGHTPLLALDRLVPGPCRVLGLWGQQDRYCIPWDCVRKIGPDIVLVDTRPEDCRVPKPKKSLRF